MNLTYTKWHNYKFTEDQKRARRMWRTAGKYDFELIDVFCVSPEKALKFNRAEWHERLDLTLDRIERIRKEAIELFPKVKESMTIAEGSF